MGFPVTNADNNTYWARENIELQSCLAEWTEGWNYEILSATYDVNDIIATGVVKWPDESFGTYTTTTANPTYSTVDAYTITYILNKNVGAGSGILTVTQAAVTRNSAGNMTVKPALVVT